MKTNILLISTYEKDFINNANPIVNDHIGQYLIDNCSDELKKQKVLSKKSDITKPNVKKPGWASSVYDILNNIGGLNEKIREAYKKNNWETFLKLVKEIKLDNNEDLTRINSIISQNSNEVIISNKESSNEISLIDIKSHLNDVAINIFQAAQRSIGDTYKHRLGVYKLKEEQLNDEDNDKTGKEKYIILAVLPLGIPCSVGIAEESNPWVNALTNVALDYCEKDDDLNLLLLLHGKDFGKDMEFNTIYFGKSINKSINRSVVLFQHNTNENYRTVKKESANPSAMSFFHIVEKLVSDDWYSKKPFKNVAFSRPIYKIWLKKIKEKHFNYLFEDEIDKKDPLYTLILNKVDKNGDIYFAEGKTENKNEYFPIRIATYAPNNLFLGQSYVKAQEDPFFQKLFVCEKNDKIEEADFVPIIHLCNSDKLLNPLYGTSSIPCYIPRSFMIMDSSIWNYLVPLTAIPYYKDLSKNIQHVESTEIEYYFFENFLRVICSICDNYESHLYNLPVAKEYADLSARTVLESYLSGSHAKGVSPYIFHSEHATAQLIKRELLDEDRLVRLKQDRKWRILLVDDKAHQHMIKDSKSGCDYKLTIVENVLKRFFKVESKPFQHNNSFSKETDIAIEYVENYKDALEALSVKKYEIVLLDYLLDQPDGIVHYGYELLEEIYRDQHEHENDEIHLSYNTIKPHHHLRMYCMFISAYSSAVHDRLLAEGLNQSEKYWFINLGACPTNTPQLFLYNLLKLMDKRLEDSHIRRLSIDGIIEVLENIFEDDLIRKNAGELYQKIQSLQYYYRNLLQDYDISVGKENLFETTKSVLVTHFLNDHINMGGLLEHVAQLVHLTAFGTIRQWPEIWEEYMYVKAQLEGQMLSEDNKERLSKLCNKIEWYILELKSSAL